MRKSASELNDDRQIVLCYVRKHPGLNAVEIKFGLIRLRVDSVRLALASLKAAGLVIKTGAGRTPGWVSV